MKLKLYKNKINEIDLSEFVKKYPGGDRHHLNDPAGKECHKLYAYLSSVFSNIRIADIGTRTGNSALSLSYNPTNYVDSYDIDKRCYENAKNNVKKNNIHFFLKNILTDRKILGYHIISLDVDPHDGNQEKACFEFLAKNNYKGLVLVDDIGPAWKKAHEWWNSIEQNKFDVTDYGHASGTGIVDFSGELKISYV